MDKEAKIVPTGQGKDLTLYFSSIPSAVLNSLNTDGTPRKRKRLDNLTQEERSLRR